jgi:hypothetical protein
LYYVSGVRIPTSSGCGVFGRLNRRQLELGVEGLSGYL